MLRSFLERLRDVIPLGLLVIILMAVVSSTYVLLRPSKEKEGRVMWTFIKERAEGYNNVIETWGLTGEDQVHVELVELFALTRRLQSGFFSGTPLPDIIEIERGAAASTWRGPVDAVGFVDIREFLKRDGLFEKINQPSFSPWTNRGHIFGLPADVHPVLLCYRADIFEEAGINVDELTTWDKFFEATAVLAKDLDGDGRPDQYPFELQESEGSVITVLMLQAGGGYFDTNDRPIMDNPINLTVLTKLANWAAAPDKLTGDLELWSGAGNRLRADGYALSWVCPDWRARRSEMYIGSLKGKVKLMPLPAWEEGGRRTSCWGGSMIGFPKVAGNFEKNWAFAKRLYLSQELARLSWKEFSVLTPVKDFWDDPIFDEPNPFYGGQPKGRLFIDQAEHVPIRNSSPYHELALREMANVLNALIRYANDNQIASAAGLEEKGRELLDRAQANVVMQVERDAFIKTLDEN